MIYLLFLAHIIIVWIGFFFSVRLFTASKRTTASVVALSSSHCLFAYQPSLYDFCNYSLTLSACSNSAFRYFFLTIYNSQCNHIFFFMVPHLATSYFHCFRCPDGSSTPLSDLVVSSVLPIILTSSRISSEQLSTAVFGGYTNMLCPHLSYDSFCRLPALF